MRHSIRPYVTTGIAIVGVETYGDLCYLIFRDRERHHFYRPFDARLEGLSDSVFDVYRIADRFEAKLHRREGKPMNLADHLTEYLRDDERAKSDARRIRAMLREPRTAKPVEGADKTFMDLLAELAKTAIAVLSSAWRLRCASARTGRAAGSGSPFCSCFESRKAASC